MADALQPARGDLVQQPFAGRQAVAAQLATHGVHQRVLGDGQVAAAEGREQGGEGQGRLGRRHRQRERQFRLIAGTGAARLDVAAAPRALAMAVDVHQMQGPAADGAAAQGAGGWVQAVVTTSSSSISLCSRFWIANRVPWIELGHDPHAPW